MNTFQLKIIAYDRIFYDGPAVSVTFPTLDGLVQLLAYHEEYVYAVTEGEIRVVTETGEIITGACGRGFIEFNSDNCAEVLVDTVEKPEEIDVRRAREAKERAQEELRQKLSVAEYHRSAASLARAMARLKEANKYHH